MRWYGQLAVIAGLGAAGYGGSRTAHKAGQLAALPVVGPWLGAGAQGPRGPAPAQAAPPPVVDVDIVKTGRIVEVREAVGTVVPMNRSQ